jgi:hypothetical protein
MNVNLLPFFVLTINDLVASLPMVARFGGIIHCRNAQKDVSLNGLYTYTYIHLYINTYIHAYMHTHTSTVGWITRSWGIWVMAPNK